MHNDTLKHETRMMRRIVNWAILIALSTSLCTQCYAAELELKFAALERIVAAQLFTQDGRHYVRGNKSNRCQFAYLETPRIDSESGRLRVRARFSGRSALNLLNQCIGLGDSFDLTLTAVPIVRNGAIALKEVNVSTPRDSYYIRRVRAALAQSISRDFKLEIREQAKQLFESSGPASSLYKQELSSLDLGEIRVAPDALILVFEFRLVVK